LTAARVCVPRRAGGRLVNHTGRVYSDSRRGRSVVVCCGAVRYSYRARYYQPSLSRFVTEDPIGFASSDLNFYEYVGSAPTIYTDPLGLEPCCGGFDCFLRCVATYRWDWKWLTGFNLGNAAGNAATGGTGRTGVGGVPPHSTSWQHKVGGALGGAAGSRFGRAVGRGALIPTIAEGYYDIGVFLACSWICTGCGR